MDLRTAQGTVAIELDERSGIPTAIVLGSADESVARLPLAFRVELETEGTERRGAIGGLDYDDTILLTRMTRTSTVVRRELADDGELFIIDTELEGWSLQWRWLLRAEQAPAVSLDLALTPPEEGSRVVRSMIVTLDTDLSTLGAEGWRVDAPGNLLRRGTRFVDLPPRTSISPAGGLRGSSALIWAGHASGIGFAIWPLCRTEIGEITLSAESGHLAVRYDTALAGEPDVGDTLVWSGWHLDLALSDWEQTLADLPDWYSAVGYSAPRDRPDWIEGASIYEVQIGHSVFWGGNVYSPYPTVRDLIDDLDRIGELGFTVIQLMPRQPYPSYNVHDYDDVETSYGPEADLTELVRLCHERGMRVLLDVLMHGVLDQESITAAADGVRTGPYFDLLDERLADTFKGDVSDTRASSISWSRHILDFEPHWSAGSPKQSPLVTEHPDWFFQDSAGTVLGVYTKAFDARSRDWQDWFLASLVRLAKRLDADGFRVDAPTYNNFANWSPSMRRRASASAMGSVGMFRRLRPMLKEVKSDFLLYTEPSGVALRESMDLNYNYDEQWLVSAAATPDTENAAWTVTTAKDLAAWIDDRNASLPCGSLTAHHIDSHDTFWWPDWGNKWRREQFGLGVTSALTAVFMLCGGPFMLFTGGEQGIESDLATLNRLKATVPALRSGSSRFADASTDSDDIFCVPRVHESQTVIVVVNLSAEPREFTVSGAAVAGARDWTDLAGEAVASVVPHGFVTALPAYGFAVFAPGR